jgi:hypothetical protein
MRQVKGKIAQNYMISIQINSTTYFLCHQTLEYVTVKNRLQLYVDN